MSYSQESINNTLKNIEEAVQKLRDERLNIHIKREELLCKKEMRTSIL